MGTDIRFFNGSRKLKVKRKKIFKLNLRNMISVKRFALRDSIFTLRKDFYIMFFS